MRVSSDPPFRDVDHSPIDASVEENRLISSQRVSDVMQHHSEIAGLLPKWRRIASIRFDNRREFPAAQIWLHMELSPFQTTAEHLIELPGIVVGTGPRSHDHLGIHCVI